MRRTDDFQERVKDLLARRVGMRCSNPNCRQLTSGPHSDPQKHVNVGVAAHISAASPGGPRYDRTLSAEERSSAENGIWLCQKCGKLVDSDDPRYTKDLLKDWKRLAEEAAQLEVEGNLPSPSDPTVKAADSNRLRFFRQCFDRPAFQDEFSLEGSIEDLDKALADTIIAVNTGTLRSRDGFMLKEGEGKSFVENDDWRESLDAIVALLRSLRQRLQVAERTHALNLGPPHDGSRFYVFNDRDLAQWVDQTRGQILLVLNQVFRAAGVPELQIPEPFGRDWR
jgi:hypothetical protein